MNWWKSILFLLRFWIDRSLWIFLLIFGLRFLSNEARRSIAAYSVGWLSTWCSFTYLPLIKSTFSAGAWIPSQHSVTCLLPVEPAFIIKLHHWKESSYRPFNPSIPSCFFLNIILCCMWCIHLYDYHISDFRCWGLLKWILQIFLTKILNIAVNACTVRPVLHDVTENIAGNKCNMLFT